MYAIDDFLMMSMNLSDISILKLKMLIIVSGISKSEAINLLQNIDLIEKKQNIIKKSKYQEQFQAVNLLQILIQTKQVENNRFKKLLKIF